MEIRQIADNLTKQSIARLILEALPDWFGIPGAGEEYLKFKYKKSKIRLTLHEFSFVKVSVLFCIKR